MNDVITLPIAWQTALADTLQHPDLQALLSFLAAQEQAGKLILPPSATRFQALQATPPDKVKVVILGQDPYPTPGHAHGLAFSVLPEVKPLPRSLKNIYKELLDDVGVDNQHSGYLQPWAEQGVLLLNTVLTVEAGNAGSHQKRGWERLTDRVIDTINGQPQPVVFVLWGGHAQKKAERIDSQRHLVIQTAHPSPLSARRGFFGSKPFSKINAFLREHGRDSIDWQV